MPSSCYFSEIWKKKEKQKEHKTNFEGVYLHDGWANSAKILDALPQGSFHSKNIEVPFRHYQITGG